MHSKEKRGQGAIEFIIIFGIILIFFIVFFAIIRGNQIQKNKEKENILFESMALDIRDEINIASEASEGYYREFTLPQNVLGKDYTVNITDIGYVYLTSEGYSVSFKASQVIGSVQKGINVIKKENGTVYLN